MFLKKLFVFQGYLLVKNKQLLLSMIDIHLHMQKIMHKKRPTLIHNLLFHHDTQASR